MKIIDDFVARFADLDEMSGFDLCEDLVVRQENGIQFWAPRPLHADPSRLSVFYKALGLPGRGSTRLPRLYEELITSYCWEEVDLQKLCLFPNLPNLGINDLQSLPLIIQKDKGLWETLYPMGFIQFAKSSWNDHAPYDPVCFDLRDRPSADDCKIVKLDHEDILCNYKINVVRVVATSFEEFVDSIIHRPPGHLDGIL